MSIGWSGLSVIHTAVLIISPIGCRPYIIVPATYYPNNKGQFWITVYAVECDASEVPVAKEKPKAKEVKGKKGSKGGTTGSPSPKRPKPVPATDDGSSLVMSLARLPWLLRFPYQASLNNAWRGMNQTWRT